MQWNQCYIKISYAEKLFSTGFSPYNKNGWIDGGFFSFMIEKRRLAALLVLWKVMLSSSHLLFRKDRPQFVCRRWEVKGKGRWRKVMTWSLEKTTCVFKHTHYVTASCIWDSIVKFHALLCHSSTRVRPIRGVVAWQIYIYSLTCRCSVPKD